MTDNNYIASTYRLTGTIFWENAKRLGATMEKTADGTPTRITELPFYFLASHAMELLLKSALLKRGWTEHDLKKYDYRHNLGGLLREMQKIGILVTPETIGIINGLHSQHLNHALRYSALIDDGEKTYMPPPALIQSTLEELLLLTRVSTQGKWESASIIKAALLIAKWALYDNMTLLP